MEYNSGSHQACDFKLAEYKGNLKLRIGLPLSCTTRSPITNKLCQKQNTRNSGMKNLMSQHIPFLLIPSKSNWNF